MLCLAYRLDKSQKHNASIPVGVLVQTERESTET